MINNKPKISLILPENDNLDRLKKTVGSTILSDYRNFEVSNPKISIILSTYNKPDNLKKAVDSILLQDYKNFEIIILDYSDTNLAYLILYEILYLNLNVTYVKCSNPDINMGEKYNHGLEIADGDYIMFFNDSTVLFKTSLLDLVEALKGNYDLAYGKIATKDFYSGRYIPNSLATMNLKMNTTLRRNNIPLASVLINKNLLNFLGGFDKDLKESFALNLWNRVFNVPAIKIKRITNTVSEAIVNDPTDAYFDGFSDLDLTNIYTKEYSLKNYWTELKRVSFNYTSFNINPYFKVIKGPWVSAGTAYVTDVLIQDRYDQELLNFTGNLIYFYDYLQEIDPYLKDNCEALITPFSIDTSNISEVSHVLRPCISKVSIDAMSRYIVQYPNEVRIGIPDITSSNLDFVLKLIPELYSRFKKIEIFHNDDISIWNNFDAYPELRFTPINFNDSSREIMDKKLSILLSVNQDYTDYISGYRLFLISVILNIPFVSTNNISFTDLMEHEKHLFIYSNGVSLADAIEKIKDVSIRSNLLKQAKALTYINFLDKAVVSRLIVFLNSVFFR